MTTKTTREKQLKANNHISTNEIKIDITDTEKEIRDFEDEKRVLMRNPVDNKLRIYMLGGHISKRKVFIKKLNQILKDRNEN